MNDTFYMWPINETGPEKKMLGHRIKGEKYGFAYDMFYVVINNIRLLIDEMTGMVNFGEYNNSEITDIDTYADEILSNANIRQDITDIHNNCMKEGIILKSCDKKIEFSFNKQNIATKKTIKSKEGIAFDFMEKFELNNYFKNVLVTRDFGQQTATTNAILINPTNYILPYARNEITLDFLSKNLVDLKNIPNSHCLYLNNCHRRGIIDTIIILKIGRYSLGYYIPTINVLILSDIFTVKEFEWITNIIEHMKKYYFKKITKTNIKKDFEITIGCDPEFELYNSENMLLIGDDLNAEGRLQKKIGADGHGKQLELRPEPSENVEDVIDDLSNLFKSVSHLRVDCKGDREPLGGHIHFGITSNKHPMTLTYTQTIADVLDVFIGRHTQCLSGKARGQYGKLGDIRNQPWGFEYRVAPAAIFATKEMAYITMKLAKRVIETIIKKDIKCSYPLSIETLNQFLSPEESKYYLEFPKMYETLKSNDIIQYWTKDRNDPIEIKFYDKWNKDIKTMFKKLLKDTIIDDKTVLCLYGVKGDYGAGIEALGKSIPHPRGVHCTEGIAIGLPRYVRIDGGSVKDICYEIKKKIGSINGTTCKRTTEYMFPDEMIGCSVTADVVDSEEEELF